MNGGYRDASMIATLIPQAHASRRHHYFRNEELTAAFRYSIGAIAKAMLEKERISRIAASLSRQSEPSRAAKMPKFGMLASWLPTGWGGSGGRVAHCRDDHAATRGRHGNPRRSALLLVYVFCLLRSRKWFPPGGVENEGAHVAFAMKAEMRVVGSP
jgi:hypothetical protein